MAHISTRSPSLLGLRGVLVMARPKKDIDWGFAERLYRAGLTDAEVCKCLGITTRAWNYRKKSSDADKFIPIRAAKDEADDRVEAALYERACGYSHPDTKPQWVESEIRDENGDWHKVGRWEYAELTKHYAPDPASCIFWLKNRRPTQWRDKQDHELALSKETLAAIINALPPGVADAVRQQLAASLPSGHNR
jgi:hypothetical protein